MEQNRIGEKLQKVHVSQLFQLKSWKLEQDRDEIEKFWIGRRTKIKHKIKIGDQKQQKSYFVHNCMCISFSTFFSRFKPTVIKWPFTVSVSFESFLLKKFISFFLFFFSSKNLLNFVFRWSYCICCFFFFGFRTFSFLVELLNVCGVWN